MNCKCFCIQWTCHHSFTDLLSMTCSMIIWHATNICKCLWVQLLIAFLSHVPMLCNRKSCCISLFSHVYLGLCRMTVSQPHPWAVEPTRQRAASRSSPQVPWFPCLGEAWAGRGVLAGLCVCCLDGCLEVCVSLSQLWGLTSGATHMTMCSCMSCWAWAVLCSAWCTRCWDRSTRSRSWLSSSSPLTSSCRRGGASRPDTAQNPKWMNQWFNKVKMLKPNISYIPRVQTYLALCFWSQNVWLSNCDSCCKSASLN